MDIAEIPSWVSLTGGGVSLGAILLLVYWFRQNLAEDRKERQEERKERLDVEAKREAARLAHDAKRDETLNQAIEKMGTRLDENTRGWAVATDVMRQCQEQHAKAARKAEA